MGIMQLLNLILFWVFFGCLASYIANKRGRHPIAWFFLGLCLGILGVLLVFVLPKVPAKKPPSPLALRPQRSEAWLKLWYYLDRARQPQGPMEFLDLAKLRKENRICDKSLIWGEGMKEWKELAELPDLIQEMERAR